MINFKIFEINNYINSEFISFNLCDSVMLHMKYYSRYVLINDMYKHEKLYI